MAKPPKYPGLQGKLERALRDHMKPETPMSGPDFLEWLEKNLATYAISDDEFAHIVDTQSNYLTRAVNNSVLVRHGKKQGYSLAASAAAPEIVDDSEPASSAQAEWPQTPGTANRQWESLLHLPLTVALGLRFDAHVLSLPAVVDGERWANPDILVVRLAERARLRLRADDLDPDVFGSADASPAVILAAVEAKFGLRRSRSLLFQAIAEAAANSRWANEAWLAFFDPDAGAEPEPLPNDALSLARAAEVGVLELLLDATDPDEPLLRVEIHAAAPTRSMIRFDEMSPDRVEVLREAQRAIQDFESLDETMLEMTPEDRVVFSTERALRNLGRHEVSVRTRLPRAIP